MLLSGVRAVARAVCGWAKPAASQNKNGAGICESCHGVLVFDLHINQWVHESTYEASRRGGDRG